jgi:hypothetical protein
VWLAEGVIRVGHTHRTKTAGSVRTVPVRGAALDILKRRADERTSEGDGYVFLSAWGNAVNVFSVSRRLAHYAEAAGLGKQVSAYSCRHSYGTRLALGGAPLFHIAKLMGTSVAMVERHYAAYSPEAGAYFVERIFGEASNGGASDGAFLRTPPRVRGSPHSPESPESPGSPESSRAEAPAAPCNTGAT